jgi:hypothetical protein
MCRDYHRAQFPWSGFSGLDGKPCKKVYQASKPLTVLNLKSRVDAFCAICISIGDRGTGSLRTGFSMQVFQARISNSDCLTQDFQNFQYQERKRLNMRIFCIAAIMAGLVATGATAQTSAGGSASGNASVTPGQASAGANASQSAQTPAASTGVNGAANAQASHPSENKKDDKTSAAAGSNSAAGVNGASSALSSGTTLQAELTKAIDAKKAKPGDEVTAKLTQDVKSSGHVVLHKGTKLVGHVTEAQARSKENSESKLGIAFDKAMLKGGEQMAFTGVIQALAAPVQGSLSAATDEGGNLGSGMGSGTAMGGGRNGGGGIAPMGGGAVNSTLGTATNTVNNTAGSVTNTATGAVNGSVTQATGVAANGAINSATRGVVGMQGVALNTVTTGSAQGSVVSSATKNVKLDTGTQMILQVTGSAAAR